MSNYDVVVVGAGFTGLTAAYALAKQGKKVHVVEADATPGGLAGTFEFADGVKLEKFYHHWFNNDVYVPELVKELGMEGDVILLPTRTGMYFNGRMWKLSTPLDLLKFKALSFIDRIRLGLLVFQVRRIKDWKTIEHLSIREWLEPICGKTVYRIVWEPLISSKFSVYAEAVNAVWMWKKLVLRGSTRNDKGGEELAYFKGGFGRLAEAMVAAIERAGGEVTFKNKVNGVLADGKKITGLETEQGELKGKQYLFTPSFPIIADMFEGTAPPEWLARLRRVRYLGNVCLVLRLNQSLSETYWLNVNDPGFPFVGVIEHTNFDKPENYQGSHIAYLSRYLAVEDPVWGYTDEQYVDFAFEHLKRMFPKMDRSWIVEHRVWRSMYAQPVTERQYSEYVPSEETPYENGWISTMAQIYPEDRGTNYAIREGKRIVEKLA
ncbi:Protoporphyrinogen oxidase [Cupriavidus necator]|uniref:NAD(P)/FAD-dependent oxidoreductase n=1 Tax=Cupriavidus necator (strain ATCC 17699 / DSM 428 / KCTC 22496 / NCIMB 10442 / H16 / Stanier 337) TaxID=381666 RepID=Q0K7Q4_CUPNH|nr:NAD(P)/FAD-dependent oxidoreductase [Cupriavidus necator]QCC01737.1 NAD(P)/FAD-dependent oxidoreductase [Cupriavidus necator H16]QQB75432.1 NAD(P)/FAD-dependent oxidoreductase [Cupriavidus necator]WKA40135.1 NAD(P)/FAD-dependent oxidoreductase [Cupriavidus necator]CAJ93967.1 protoporphyrinogen oxidase [Cupriavidus necator H16]